MHNMLDNINAQSYGWLKAKHNDFAFNYHMWWLNSLKFL